MTEGSRTIEPPTSDYVRAVVSPALVHIILLFGLLSSNLFVRRHTQQALGLVALLVISAAVFMGLMRGEGVTPWLLVNGSLWLFGTIWGIRQVKRGECWLMRVRGEGAELPRPWAVIAPEIAEPIAPPTAAPPAPKISREPGEAFEIGKRLIGLGKREEALQNFLYAFRNGSPELRRRAVAELERLGEVDIS